MQEQDEINKTINSLNKQVGNPVSNIPPSGAPTTQEKPDFEPIFKEPYVGPIDIPFIGGKPFEMKEMDIEAGRDIYKDR